MLGVFEVSAQIDGSQTVLLYLQARHQAVIGAISSQIMDLLFPIVTLIGHINITGCDGQQRCARCIPVQPHTVSLQTQT